MARKIGFIQHNEEKDDEKQKKEKLDVKIYNVILDAYFQKEDDSGYWTSEEIRENLMETLKIPLVYINAYMIARGYHLERQDDRLVWVKGKTFLTE